MDNIQIRSIGAFPLVYEYMKKLKVFEVLDKAMPTSIQAKTNTAEALCFLIINIIDSSQPLYHVELWLKDFVDGIHKPADKAAVFNDDKLGRSLDILHGATRGDILSILSANAIKEHELEIDAFHNDTTSITLKGLYKSDDSKAIKPNYGYNKDGHKDCKQIVFGLTTTDDGCVPLHYKAYDGNQADNKTHIDVWKSIRDMIGKEGFIYVSDSKLCTMENMTTIAKHGGLFISIMPATRKELKSFYEKLKNNKVTWTGEYITPCTRKSEVDILYRFFEGELSAEGYKIIWTHSSAKKNIETTRRLKKLNQIEEALSELNGKLNQDYLKTKEQIKEAAKAITKDFEQFIDVDILARITEKQKHNNPGRPKVSSESEIIEEIRYQLKWSRREEAILEAEKCDGVFPLITNTELEAEAVLKQYKKQAYLEKRHSTLKSVLNVAPVYLKKNIRIEAILFLYFIALMIVSLIERRIRLSMKACGIKKLNLPEQKVKISAPTWARINKHFRNVNILYDENTGNTSQVKGIMDTHENILQLLGTSRDIYDSARKDNWWRFESLEQ